MFRTKKELLERGVFCCREGIEEKGIEELSSKIIIFLFKLYFTSSLNHVFSIFLWCLCTVQTKIKSTKHSHASALGSSLHRSPFFFSLSLQSVFIRPTVLLPHRCHQLARVATAQPPHDQNRRRLLPITIAKVLRTCTTTLRWVVFWIIFICKKSSQRGGWFKFF